MINYNKEELAWAAGFFDGEGSFYYVKPNLSKSRRNGRGGLSLGQTDVRPIERFIKAINLPLKIYKRTGKSLGSRTFGRVKPLYVIQIGKFEQIQQIYACLHLWLSPPKKEQYAKVLKSLLERA